MSVPSDPFILLSYVNTALRDQYDSLSHLTEDLDIDRTWLEEKLGSIGYTYDSQLNQFK